MQLAYGRRRVGAQRLRERTAQLLERGQRLRRPPRRAQRPHASRPQPLAEGVGGGQLLQLGDQVSGVAEVEPDLGQVLDGTQPQLDQPGGHRGESGRLQIGQRLPPPQRQRFGEPPRREGETLGAPGPVPGRPAGRHQSLQPPHVGLVQGERQQIPGRPGLQPVPLTRRQGTAQPRDERLQRVDRPRRRLVRPHRVDQSLRRNRAARGQREPRQQRAQPDPGDLDRRAGVVACLQGAEKRDPHAVSVSRVQRASPPRQAAEARHYWSWSFSVRRCCSR